MGSVGKRFGGASMMRVMHGKKNVREQKAEKWREKGCQCRWMRRGTSAFINGTEGWGSIDAKTIKREDSAGSMSQDT